jgi:hypothetical protein
MFFEPLMTDVSQPRWPDVVISPGNPCRDGAEDSNGDDDPEWVHREASSFMLFATIREYWIRVGENVRNGTAIRTVAALLQDAAWLALIVVLFPLGILLIGAPIAACVRVLVEIAHRL